MHESANRPPEEMQTQIEAYDPALFKEQHAKMVAKLEVATATDALTVHTCKLRATDVNRERERGRERDE